LIEKTDDTHAWLFDPILTAIGGPAEWSAMRTEEEP
jgi:hypothetical protein